MTCNEERNQFIMTYLELRQVVELGSRMSEENLWSGND